MDAVMTKDEAAAQLRLYVERRDAAVGQRDQFAKLVDAYQKIIDGLELIYPGTQAEREEAVEPPERVEVSLNLWQESESTRDTPPSPGIGRRRKVHAGTTETVGTLLEDLDGAWVTVNEIKDMLDQTGWQPESDSPDNIIRAALGRLRNQGRVFARSVDGRTKAYSTAPAKQSGATAAVPPAAIAPEPSDGQRGGETGVQADVPSDRHHDPARRDDHRVGPSVGVDQA